MSEKDLHTKLRNWAYAKYGEIDVERGTGILKIVKQTMLAQYGEAGATDWAVYIQGGHAFFVELKNPDGSGQCTDKQLHWHAQLRALGFKVYVVDNFGLGKAVIDQEVRRRAT